MSRRSEFAPLDGSNFRRRTFDDASIARAIYDGRSIQSA